MIKNIDPPIFIYASGLALFLCLLALPSPPSPDVPRCEDLVGGELNGRECLISLAPFAGKQSPGSPRPASSTQIGRCMDGETDTGVASEHLDRMELRLVSDVPRCSSK